MLLPLGILLLSVTTATECNYASSDCSARIVASSPGCDKPRSILNADNDAYGRFLSDREHWLVVELCESIQLGTLQLVNRELFSNSFDTVDVFSSKRLDDWLFVGTFSACERIQLPPQGFVKYVRLELHTGSRRHFYTTITSLRVTGKTMMEDFESNKGSTGLITVPPCQSAVASEENVFKAMYERLALLEGDTRAMLQSLMHVPISRPVDWWRVVGVQLVLTIITGAIVYMLLNRRLFAHSGRATPSYVPAARPFTPARVILDGEEPVNILSTSPYAIRPSSNSSTSPKRRHL